MTIYGPSIGTLWRLTESYGHDPHLVIPAEIYTPGDRDKVHARTSYEAFSKMRSQAAERLQILGEIRDHVAVIPAMVERGRGHLVGVSSLASYRGLPKLAVYSATKAYMRAMLEGMRVDLAPKGICVTEVRPGYVRAAVNEGYRPSQTRNTAPG